MGTVSGVAGGILLALYLWCDSFTSSWQAALFQQHQLHPLQMLAAVNMFSVALTATSLLHRAHTPTPLLQVPLCTVSPPLPTPPLLNIHLPIH